jgi:uncharacterized metal-binding protein
MPHEADLLADVKQIYLEDETVRRLAVESARTESYGYCELTRIEEIMDFARRMGMQKLGIAHCIGLSHEARLAREILITGGFTVYTACCKVGTIPKESIGLAEDDKIHPGEFEALCSPLGQAAVLDKAGTEFNIVMGLCVGHDSLFFTHSKAPVTVLVAKDRVLGHNPVACLHSRYYYDRLTERAG